MQSVAERVEKNLKLKKEMQKNESSKMGSVHGKSLLTENNNDSEHKKPTKYVKPDASSKILDNTSSKKLLWLK